AACNPTPAKTPCGYRCRGRSDGGSCCYAPSRFGSFHGVAPPRRWTAPAVAGGEVEVPELATVSTGVPSQVGTCQSPFLSRGQGTHRACQGGPVQGGGTHPAKASGPAGCPHELGHHVQTCDAQTLFTQLGFGAQVRI